MGRKLRGGLRNLLSKWEKSVSKEVYRKHQIVPLYEFITISAKKEVLKGVLQEVTDS